MALRERVGGKISGKKVTTQERWKEREEGGRLSRSTNGKEDN